MIKIATKKEANVLATLAIKMWKEHEIDVLMQEFCELLNNKDVACFIKYIDDLPIAFAECQLRHDYVEGTSSSPVGYLEGIFVLEGYRKKGYAKELLTECEKWAKGKGCIEFASDCEIDNTDSLEFHIAMGFEETNRIICFKKKL